MYFVIFLLYYNVYLERTTTLRPARAYPVGKGRQVASVAADSAGTVAGVVLQIHYERGDIH